MISRIGNGSIPLRIGNLIDTKVYGGPYRDFGSWEHIPGMFGVKMAVEIDAPCHVAVDTKDYNVPKVSDLQAGITRSLMAMINDQPVYVGCWGGIGRTGLFLAALAKVQIEYRKAKHRSGRGEDPVLYVRKHFIPHAVETLEQKDFIAAFDVSQIVSWLELTQVAMGLGGFTPPKEATDYTAIEDRILTAQTAALTEGKVIVTADQTKSDQFESRSKLIRLSPTGRVLQELPLQKLKPKEPQTKMVPDVDANGVLRGYDLEEVVDCPACGREGEGFYTAADCGCIGGNSLRIREARREKAQTGNWKPLYGDRIGTLDAEQDDSAVEHSNDIEKQLLSLQNQIDEQREDYRKLISITADTFDKCAPRNTLTKQTWRERIMSMFVK